MRTIAHIINPFYAHESSDLCSAQPLTMASMINAKHHAKNVAEISLFTTKFEEDSIEIPTDFISAKSLSRSVLNAQDFNKKIKLPFIIDILENLYKSTDAEYLIYTNIDIGLYPKFYQKVN